MQGKHGILYNTRYTGDAFGGVIRPPRRGKELGAGADWQGSIRVLVLVLVRKNWFDGK
jgi:hypothetical protein